MPSVDMDSNFREPCSLGRNEPPTRYCIVVCTVQYKCGTFGDQKNYEQMKSELVICAEPGTVQVVRPHRQLLHISKCAQSQISTSSGLLFWFPWPVLYEYEAIRYSYSLFLYLFSCTVSILCTLLLTTLILCSIDYG